MTGPANLPHLIGITGKAGAGKDTTAAMLVQRHGYARRSLADPIKELLNARFGWTREQWDDREWKERPALLSADTADEHEPKYGRQAPQVPRAAWSPRQLAQWLGTEVGRDTFGENVWVNKLLDDWAARDCPALVVPDVRFDNEAKAIIRAGGLILEVIRPGLPPVAAHSSEAGVSHHLVHLRVDNTGTVDELADNAERVLLRAVGAT